MAENQINPPTVVGEVMKVFVKTTDGKMVHIPFGPNTTVKTIALRAANALALGNNADLINLVHAGKTLNEKPEHGGKTLTSLGIQHQAVIYAVARLPGGQI